MKTKISRTKVTLDILSGLPPSTRRQGNEGRRTSDDVPGRKAYTTHHPSAGFIPPEDTSQTLLCVSGSLLHSAITNPFGETAWERAAPEQTRFPLQMLEAFSIAFIEDRPFIWAAPRGDDEDATASPRSDITSQSSPWSPCSSSSPKSNKSGDTMLSFDSEFERWRDIVPSLGSPDEPWAETAKTRAEQRQRSLLAALNSKRNK